MSYLSTAAISDLASKDTNRITGSIAKALAYNSPFLAIVKGGVFKNGISDTVRSVVQEQAMPGDSLAVPSFTNDISACGLDGSAEQVATVEYTYQLESKRGRGPKVCVKQGRSAFKDSYLRAEESLKSLITQYVNADIRAQLYLRSGAKFVASANYQFSDLFTGGEGSISVPFAQGINLPTGPLSFKALHTVARYLNEVLRGEMFDDGKLGPHYKFIGGGDQVEYFRNDVGVENKLIAFTTGGYKLGEVALKAFSFEESPAYRGIAFGVDHRPLRCNSFDASGNPILINPVVAKATTKGVAAVPNPAWLAALYEIGFLIAQNSFERQTPEQYVGEGSFRFAPQLHSGELNWHFNVDNDQNEWGDYGYHKYQITRAYRPIRPHHVIPILYKRCIADLSLSTCSVTTVSTFQNNLYL